MKPHLCYAQHCLLSNAWENSMSSIVVLISMKTAGSVF